MDVFRDGDRVWKLFGMMRDITDQKEKEILQTDRLIMLQTTLNKTVEALARMTEIRAPYTAGHQIRVARLAKEMGKRMGLDPARLEGLEIAAKLHDIGKIYVPAEFLAKPGTLREAEMSLMKYHPEIGHQIIQDIPFTMPVADIIIQHHRRGRGVRGHVLLPPLQARPWAGGCIDGVARKKGQVLRFIRRGRTGSHHRRTP